ncbi:stalk domain-containing protein [Paenibacillus sp. GCM10012307]|uniref:Trypsin-like peptidase domain-containing protein n=1 Tax=Paenibacillus roseus TaxID=2798579 RepID=A0A934J714_9BACL|nr:stalk domain-containing protein [Paenibacillus roseus]MBJ6361468.1 trypsin-like peptidase domain-containing protein [Paenibacillus roseus]
MKKMVQKLVLSLFAVGLAAAPLSGLQAVQTASAASTAVQSKIQVYLDGKKIAFQPDPIQEKGTTLVPMRPLFEALGANISWNEQTQTVIAKKDNTVISLKIGSTRAAVNNKSLVLDVPAKVVNGATLVPLRFVGESLDASIKWEASSRSIHITSAEQRNEDNWKKIEESKLTVAQNVALNDNKVVMIETDRSQGSGVVVGKRLILTNYHVMTSTKSAKATTLNGKEFKVEGLVAYNKDADLALIQTSTDIGISSVTLGDDKEIRKGDKIIAIGSPRGVRNTVSQGLISNIYFENGVQHFQINAPIDHGSSGGGLFDEFGNLIGLTTSKVEGSSADLNFAVSVYSIYKLLDDYEQSGSKNPAFLPSTLPDTLKGASNEEIAKLMEKEFGGIQTENGTTTLQNWKVSRDSQGWLVITANMEPAFYMIYAESIAPYNRLWALRTLGDLKQMLPDDTIELIVYYEQTFNYEPRGLNPGEVTALGDGKWKVRYPIIHAQVKERAHVDIRT